MERTTVRPRRGQPKFESEGKHFISGKPFMPAARVRMPDIKYKIVYFLGGGGTNKKQ